MADALRTLFAQQTARAIFVATACGYAFLSFVQRVIHGFITTPLAFPSKFDAVSLPLAESVGYSSRASAAVAGRSLDWLQPLEAAIVLALVIGGVAAVLRAIR